MLSTLSYPCLTSVASGQSSENCKIYLVGMGPGAADLVTFRAAKVLKDADIVFCFGYLEDEVARHASPEKISVASPLLMARVLGRNPAELPPEMRHQVMQSMEQRTRLSTHVRRLVAVGKLVVFADAGNPTIFCPWSWVTAEFADLQPVVVPGLSSFDAADAALQQGSAQRRGAVLISAGDDLGAPDNDGRLKMTLVFFTHRMKLKEVVSKLRERYPLDTPVAVVCEASYPTEHIVWGTIGTVLEKFDRKELPHLYLVYAGDALQAPVRSDSVRKHN